MIKSCRKPSTKAAYPGYPIPGSRDKLWRVGGQASVVNQCPCCKYRTGCVTCPVCFWTDPGQADPTAFVAVGGPNGDLSLNEARLNFALYGASHPKYREVVRKPRPDEMG
ncbi:CPCC family cysteine-rich protein [Actinomycetes bacterium KLBMP 9797]